MAFTTTAVGVKTRSIDEIAQKSRAPVQTLGKNEFFHLLVTQMANQDPMEPTDNTAFIAQLAQFSSLETMQSLSATLQSSQAYSLIGKYVAITEVKDGIENILYGRADGVLNEKGTSYIVVGENKYELSQVSAVLNIKETDILTQANLVGKFITATWTEMVPGEGAQEGTMVPKEFTVTGIVDKLVETNNALYAVVYGQKVELDKIVEIAMAESFENTEEIAL